MERRQLGYFMRIAELGSFRRASEVLHVAQPALSRQMRQLEETVGVALFQRSSRGIQLTEAGELLRERAGFILRQLEQAQLDVEARGTVPRGEVSFGAPVSIAVSLYPRLVARYHASYPQVRIRLFEGIGHLWDWLSRGEIDLAVLPNSEGNPVQNFVLKRLAAEPVYLVGRSDDGTMPTASVSLTEVGRRALIVTGHPNTTRREIERHAAQQGRTVHVAVETENLAVQFALVRKGLGNAVLPYSALHRILRDDAFQICPIDGVTLYRTLAWRGDRPLTPAVAKLIEFVTGEAESLKDEGFFGGL